MQPSILKYATACTALDTIDHTKDSNFDSAIPVDFANKTTNVVTVLSARTRVFDHALVQHSLTVCAKVGRIRRGCRISRFFRLCRHRNDTHRTRLHRHLRAAFDIHLFRLWTVNTQLRAYTVTRRTRRQTVWGETTIDRPAKSDDFLSLPLPLHSTVVNEPEFTHRHAYHARRT